MQKLILTLISGWLLLFTPAMAKKSAISNQRVLSDVQTQKEYLIGQRRHFHQYPEVSGKEFETSKYLKQEMQKLSGIELHDVPNSTGFYAIMDTGRPGKTIGLRTDIDALPIQECDVNASGKARTVISQVPGVMQACGHDGHMAILLTTARILHGMRDKLSGRFIFLFEQGEENSSGIGPMIEAIKDIHFDVIYGSHVYSGLQSGLVFLKEGPMMAGMIQVGFKVNGKGGHGSRPDLSISPVFATADVLTSLNVAWNAQRDITKFLSLGITMIQGGEAYNVFPNQVYVGGSYRFLDIDEAHKAISVTRNVATNVAAAHRCTVDFEDYPMFEPVINDTTATRFAQQVVDELIPGHVVSGQQYVWYASESFSDYRRLCPTVFALVGIANEEAGSTAQHHNDKFDIDEDALPYGVMSMVQFAVRYSQQ